MSSPLNEVFWTSESDVTKSEHIVFLGVFNASRFRKKIESWLSEIDLSGTHLVIADNCSTDDSLTWLTSLCEVLKSPATITRNSKNFGGYGNLAVNMASFPSAEWVTTLHQDDSYKVDHVQNHRSLILEKHDDLGMICSEARSVLPDGSSVAYPRAHWLLDDQADAVTIFLANLKNHTFPFSGASFARDVIDGFPIPWHSTAFPDTEIVMKMCMEFKVRFAKGVTVEYLENPESESHSLTAEHRDFGAFQALIRVFGHPNYRKLCLQIKESEQSLFIQALIDGIGERISDRRLGLLLKQAVLEITAEHLGTFPALASELAKGYQSVGDKGAVSILEALGADSPSPQGFDLEEIGRPPQTKPSPEIFRLAQKVFGLLPRRIQRIFFRRAMKSKIVRSRLKAWDFRWREK